jgi:hypothetical protein
VSHQFTYSGNVYDQSAAGTTTFALVSTEGNNIAYLQKSHIHVYLSTDSGVTWTELARPAEWDFDQQGTSVVLDSAIATGEWVKVQRITPYEDRYVTFQEGSLLTSDELNEGENFSMYVDQELFDETQDVRESKVTQVTGAAPINVLNQDPLNPTVTLQRITGAQATVDPTNPSWNTDEFIATPAATERVYANLVGDGAGYPGAGNVGKTGKLRIDNTGATPRFFYWDQTLPTPAWVEVQTTGAQGPPGPTGPAPGLQTPATTVTNVPNNQDGTPGAATVTIDQDPGTDELLFNFGIPVGSTGPQGPQGEPGAAGAGVTYLGPIDPTTVGPPASPDNGDFFVVSQAGTPVGGWGLATVAVNDRLIFNSNTGAWDQFAAAGQVVNLDYTAAANGGTVTCSAGDDAALPLANVTNAGLFSPTDKAKLDGIATGAEVNVQSDWNVADTNSDAFIRNKPTIPAAQVQSNWNQTDSGQVDFIQNKPTIPQAPVNSDWNASSGLAEILNKPTIPAAQVNSDWDATTGVAQILNKPDINLGYTTAASTGTVTNTAGNDATIPAATTTTAGLLTSADKSKLDGISPGAGAGTVTSIATSGAITGGTITTSGTITARDASVNQTGVVQLDNSTASTSTTTAATANAVRVAMNQANTATTNAATAQSTADSASTAASNAQSTANTANSTANTANTTANAALARAGGTMTGGVYQTVRTIGNNSTWNMNTGNLWTFAGGTIANPSNATAGTSGLIRVTGAISGWGTNFDFPGGTALAPATPAVIAYYVATSNQILLSSPVEGLA